MDRNVCKTIKTLRKERGLSQEEFGKLLGFSARTVSDWENGKTEPSIATIKAMVKFFDITYDEFFEED
ncbi:MAG: helix-turn-helix transcriptional regulator [Clostridiales bacterium]|nr:helix-turn-helix transcriptional regulator [Clostridiales bacterium]